MISTTFDKQGNTLLYYAIANFDCSVVQFLLDSKIDVNSSINKQGDRALHVSAQYGQLEIVKMLLGHKADVNFKNKENSTSLHSAAISGNVEMATLLFQNEGDIHAVNSKGQTILHVASRYKNSSVAKFCIDNGVDVNLVDNTGDIALHRANEEITEMLINAGSLLDVKNNCAHAPLNHVLNGDEEDDVIDDHRDDYFAKNYKERDNYIHKELKIAQLLITAGAKTDVLDLQTAIEQKNFKLAELIIKNNYDLESKGFDGETALLYLSKLGYLEFIKILIEKGANINVRDNDNKSLLHYSIKNSYELTEYILSKNPDYTNLELPHLVYNDKKMLSFLIKAGVDINEVDDDGNTCLHLALKSNYANYNSNVDNICTFNPDYTIVNDFGESPLYLAYEMNNKSYFNKFLTTNIDVNTIANDDSTYFHHALKHYEDEFIYKLFKFNIDFSNVDNNGNSILHTAVQRCKDNVIEIPVLRRVGENTKMTLVWEKINLIETIIKDANVDINVQNKSGKTPLMLACEKDDKYKFELLLKSGARVDILDNEGNTVLHYATKREDSFLKLLKNEIKILSE